MNKVLILLFCYFLLIGCTNPSNDGVAPEVDLDDAVSILTALDGAPDPGERILNQADGTPLSEVQVEQWHPLKTEYALFNPRSEVFSSGMVQSNGMYNVLFEDSTESFTPTNPITGDQAWLRDKLQTSIMADFNADGVDDVLILSTAGTQKTGPLQATIYSEGNLQSFQDLPAAITAMGQVNVPVDLIFGDSAGVVTNLTFDAIPCNIDEDDEREILLVSAGRVYLIDVKAVGSRWTYEYLKHWDTPNQTFVTGISAGDMNGDGLDEIAISSQGTYNLIDGGNHSITNPAWSGIPGSGTASISSSAMGDFNGNGRMELAMVYTNNQDTVFVGYYSYDGTKYEEIERRELDINSTTISTFFLAPQALDIDNDSIDELYAMGHFITDLADSSTDWYSPWPGTCAGNSSPFMTAVGDVDDDKREDLVYLDIYKDGDQRKGTLAAMGMNSSNQLGPRAQYFSNRNYQNGEALTLSVGNMDRDSSMVRYLEHEMLYTNPIVAALLIAPPYHSDIAAVDSDYNYNEWATSYTRFNGSGSADSTNLGFSVGATLEVDGKVSIFGINLGRVYSSTTLTGSFDWRMTESFMITKSETFNAYGGSDRVIFATVPMDVYRYEVIENVEDPESIGDILEISIPRDFGMHNVPLDHYNRNNGDLQDIAVSHHVGNLSSYPSTVPDDASYSAGPLPVASYSGGDNGLGITVETGEEEEFTMDLAVDQSIGAGSGPVTVLVNLGFHGGYSYSSVITEGSEFYGHVGYLPADYVSNPGFTYSSGLYVRKRLEAPQQYWEIGYWVE